MAGSGIWECKIGQADWDKLPMGADAPMRNAVYRAYYELTGHHPEYCFSGWDGSLTDSEKASVDATNKR